MTEPRRVTTPDGFVFVQYVDGRIVVETAPQMGNDGYMMPGSSGGPGQGHRYTPGQPEWGDIVAKIGPHPAFVAYLAANAADDDEADGYGRSGSYGAYGSPHRYGAVGTNMYGAVDDGSAQRPDEEPAPRFWSDFRDVLSGFTDEPEGDIGITVAAGVDAAPGIQAAIHGIIHPGTIQALTRELGRLKGKLRQERNPVKQQVLRERIKGVEMQIAEYRAAVYGQSEAPEAGGASPVWIGVSVVGLAGLLGLAYVMSRRD